MNFHVALCSHPHNTQDPKPYSVFLYKHSDDAEYPLALYFSTREEAFAAFETLEAQPDYATALQLYSVIQEY